MYSIVGKASLVTKIYIPREILTFSSVISALISSFLEFLEKKSKKTFSIFAAVL